MVVEHSRRRCLLCDATFSGLAFVCRPCAERYRREPVPPGVLRRFYHEVDREYPEWANTYGNYNPPRALLKYLDKRDRDLRVLEIGAGGGFLLQELWDLGFRDLTGSDITTTSMAEMRSREMELKVVGADAESLPFADGAFDLVISSDVLEHLPRPPEHIAEVRRVLGTGGRYLIKTPNRHLAESYYLLRGLYDYNIWHPSMVGPGEIKRLLRRNGFEAEILPGVELTAAQLRKIPTGVLRRVVSNMPVKYLPARLRPHIECVAIKT